MKFYSLQQAPIQRLDLNRFKLALIRLVDSIQVSAVPIPAAVVLLAGGLLGLGAFRKREVASKA
jgi:hypothetical protein